MIMHTKSRWIFQAALTLGSLSGARTVLAQQATPAQPAESTAASCESSYEKAQTDRVAGHYLSAQSAALACSQIQCNQAIVRECMRLYESLQQDTPTLVFAARKAEGGELIEVKVEMDGKQIAERITGRPMPVDPGPHQFAFIEPARGRIETTESARVGDHARVIEVTFPDPNAKNAPGAPGVVTPNQVPVTPQKRGIPPMTFVLGGIGVVGLASFAYFRVSGVGDYNHYNSTCSPECNPNDIDKVRTKFTASYISLGVGLAGVAGSALVFVLSRTGEHASTEARVEPLEGGAMARLRTRF